MGIVARASSKSEKLSEVQCCNFPTEAELTSDQTSHMHTIYVIYILEYGRDRFHSVPDPGKIFEFLGLHF